MDDSQDFVSFLKICLTSIKLVQKKGAKTEIQVSEFSLLQMLICAVQKWLAGLNQSDAINHKSEMVEWGDSALIKFTFVCLINLMIRGLTVWSAFLFLWVWIWRTAADKRWHHIYSSCHILN